MRTTVEGKQLRAAAYAGTYVVVLAWDTLDGKPPQMPDLLGYGIERAELDSTGKVVERYWMRGIKRFQNKDKGLPPGTPVSTAEHPIQSFLWADYTAKAGTHYHYRIVPISGTPKNTQLHEADAVTLDIAAELEQDTSLGGPRHDIYFNRGLIGSQAYAREFGNREPEKMKPESAEMKWLSRGLFEALIGFIGTARDGMSLRAALYEFYYQPVAYAFAKAIEAGVDVKIVYDAESSYKLQNLATIQAAGLASNGTAIGRSVTEGIRHNKFIVLMENDIPIAVWTGSTNISAGGIFGHSNVGHVIRDETVAAKYLVYWQSLADNLTPAKLRKLNRTLTPTPPGKPLANSVTPLFSARDDRESNETLDWYSQLMAGAKEVLCTTFAFNIDDTFQRVLAADNEVLRYVVKDDLLGEGESIGRDRDVIFAAGGYFTDGLLANFLEERKNPLNVNRYIHNKFILIDPLGADPTVITGSANFSKPSQRVNDENMLVIRGNTRVADIYFGEFMRVFDHHYVRYIIHLLSKRNGDANIGAGYLKEHANDWVPSHYNPDSYKYKRRRYFTVPSK